MPKFRVLRHEVIQPLDQSYRLIPLTQGQNAIVDAADFEWLSRWNWHARWNERGKTFYAARTTLKAPNIYMHNFICRCKPKFVDHADRNGLNNKRENLRPCTIQQNNANRKKLRNGKLAYKGIAFNNACRKKWIAQIGISGKRKHLGCFNTPEEAAKAYDKAAKIFHGEFAVLNFP